MSKLSKGAVNLLAQVASCGAVLWRDIANMNQYGQLSKTALKKLKSFGLRCDELEAAGLIRTVGDHDKAIIEPAGFTYLIERGYEVDFAGNYLLPGQKLPKWAE